jgi:glycosyltransferase involved in cell wall biosynthesis
MPRIAFVVSEFPRPVDAYFLRELLALDRRGLDLCIYSLRRPARTAAPRGAEALLGRTVYAPAAGSVAMRRAHAGWLREAAGRYAAALAAAARGHAPSPRLLAKVLAVWPQTVWFAARARTDRVAHLHANWATYPAAAAAAIARLTGLPWSFAGHASDIYLDATDLAAKLRAARFVTTCTEDNRRYLTRLAPDVDPGRVHTVYHGIDLGAFTAERADGADLHVLAVGTLRDCKGFDTLLQALARLHGAGVPARLTVIGDGENRPALERLARALGVAAHATFTGYLPHEDVIRAYARASVLVLPARAANHFGIPNVILEAQAARLPVVCTPLPALAELIEEGTSGVYVPEDDVERLAAALGALHADPARARRLGEEGRRRVVERFDLERTVGTLARLFGVAAETAPVAREAVA